MKETIIILLTCSILIFTHSCTKFIDEDSLDLEYAGDKIVMNGFISNEGVELKISRSIAPGTPYFITDFLLENEAEVTFKSNDGVVIEAIEFDSISGTYRLDAPFPIEKTYSIEVSHPNLPSVKTKSLTFPQSTRNFSASISGRLSDEVNEFPFSVRGTFDESGYFIIQPIIQEEPGVKREASYIYNNYDGLFQDQCGIENSSINLVSDIHCFSSDSILIEGVYVFSDYQSSTGFDRAVAKPTNIGLRTGWITEDDYRYFLSLRRNQNFLEDYLTTEDIINSNVTGGYGYVFTVRGQSHWLE